MSDKKERKGLWLDPRTKILLLLLCVLSAAMAPSLFYEMLLVGVIAVYGMLCRKVRYSIIAVIAYIIICFLTLGSFKLHGTIQVMLTAFFGLVHKVYPCGVLSGIIISNTKVGEFLSAMYRSHVSKKVVIPVGSYAAVCADHQGGLALHKGCYENAGCVPFFEEPAYASRNDG